jgi:hypothetical protein
MADGPESLGDEVRATDAPESLGEEALAADAARKKRRLLLMLGVVPLVVGGLAYLYVVMSARAAKAAIEAAWQTAASCVLGGPLAEGESAALRARRIQLAELVRPSGEGEAAWPASCADSIAQLQVTMKEHGFGDEALAQKAEALAVEIRKADRAKDHSDLLGDFVAAARERGLRTDALPAADKATTPAPIVALDVDALPETARLSERQYQLDKVQTQNWLGTELHVLLHDPQLGREPIVCTMTGAGPQAKCRKLGGELAGKSGLTLSGTADAGAVPLVLAGHKGEDGIYRGDSGDKVGAMRIESAHVGKDGYVAVAGPEIDFKTGEFDFAQQKKPGAPFETTRIDPEKLEVPSILKGVVVFGLLMIQTYDEEGAKKPHLQYKTLPTDKPGAKFVDAHELNWINAPYVLCQSALTTAFRVGTNEGFLTFFEGGKWSTPFYVSSFYGDNLVCVGEEVRIGGDAGAQRCNKAGCQELQPLSPEFGKVALKEGLRTLLADQVLAIATTTDRSGIRYGYGKGGAQVLFDDQIGDGKVQVESTVSGLRLFSMADFAVLLMGTGKGVYGLYFDKSGAPKPLTISW